MRAERVRGSRFSGVKVVLFLMALIGCTAEPGAEPGHTSPASGAHEVDVAEPAFHLREVAGVWFREEYGQPVFLSISASGDFFIERGSLSDLSAQWGTLEIIGDDLRFVAMVPTDECPMNDWSLTGVSLLSPGVMSWETSVNRCGGPSGPAPFTMERIDLLGARTPTETGSVAPRRADLVGIWLEGDSLVQYSSDGSYTTWGSGGIGFTADRTGSWTLGPGGRLRILHDAGRHCVHGPGQGPTSFLGHVDRTHLLEIDRAQLVDPATMSIVTAKDRCVGHEDDLRMQVKLSPVPRSPYRRIAEVASGTDAWGGGWSIAIFHQPFTSEVCIGELSGSGRSVEGSCGPEDDPVARWARNPQPLDVVKRHEVMGLGGSIHAWGFIEAPVTTVRGRFTDAYLGGKRRTAPRVYELPERFGDRINVFVLSCGCDHASLFGLDANGQRVAELNF